MLIPQIVLDETLNNFGREVQVAVGTVIKLLRDRSPNIDIAGEIIRFKSRIETRLLKELNAEILTIPDVTHGDLVSRAMMRRRPFDQQGGGYRDALIWFSLLESLKKTNDIILFVTNDVKAFWNEKRDGLHPDLIEDLKKAGFKKDRILVFASVEELNTKIIKPKLASLEEIQALLTEDRFGTLRVNEILREYKSEFERELRGSNLERLVRSSGWGVLHYLKDPQFVEMEKSDGVKALEVFELAGGDLFIRYEIEIPVILSGWVENEGHARSLRHEANFERDDPDPWNDVISGTAFPTLIAEFEVVWRKETEEVDEFELQSLSF